jgi:hypothetical protein
MIKQFFLVADSGSITTLFFRFRFNFSIFSHFDYRLGNRQSDRDKRSRGKNLIFTVNGDLCVVVFKRESQQNPQNLESGGSADRPVTNFYGFPIQK